MIWIQARAVDSPHFAPVYSDVTFLGRSSCLLVSVSLYIINWCIIYVRSGEAGYG